MSVISEIPDTISDHADYHGEKFECVLLSFTPDGSWFLTGFGSTSFESLDTVAEVLGEASELIGSEHEPEVMH
jgi:hypothetical protein